MSPKILAAPNLTHVVSVGDLTVTTQRNGTLSTFALGTCLGVIIYDVVKKFAGLAHIMLPDSSLSPEKAIIRPGMFADSAIPKLVYDLEANGSEKNDLSVLIAGGASTLAQSDFFKIGERNINTARKIFKDFGISVKIQETGGINNRTLHFNIERGVVFIKTPGGDKTLSLV